MAHKRKGQLTVSGEWARHLRPWLRRIFWKTERQAEKTLVRAEERGGERPLGRPETVKESPIVAGAPIRCRMAACREALDDGKAWSFYLLNDSEIALDSVVLHAVGYEWGDFGNSEAADGRIADLAPGANALVWRDDGNGAELRMDLSLRVTARGQEARLRYEFPRLYRLKNLPLVEGLGKAGWLGTALGREG